MITLLGACLIDAAVAAYVALLAAGKGPLTEGREAAYAVADKRWREITTVLTEDELIAINARLAVLL